jgi:5-methylcytosine-specific restriction endonuclease McrA
MRKNRSQAYNSTDEEFTQAVKDNYSVRAVLRQLGLKAAGGAYKVFWNRVSKLNLDTSHFTGQLWSKGKTGLPCYTKKTPTEDVLVENYQGGISSHTLKLRLYKEGLKVEKCEECGIIEWNGSTISMHLDHINGVNNDNRIENLRILCPNCHSQTSTYCGKNNRTQKLL